MRLDARQLGLEAGRGLGLEAGVVQEVDHHRHQVVAQLGPEALGLAGEVVERGPRGLGVAQLSAGDRRAHHRQPAEVLVLHRVGDLVGQPERGQGALAVARGIPGPGQADQREGEGVRVGRLRPRRGGRLAARGPRDRRGDGLAASAADRPAAGACTAGDSASGPGPSPGPEDPRAIRTVPPSRAAGTVNSTAVSPSFRRNITLSTPFASKATRTETIAAPIGVEQANATVILEQRGRDRHHGRRRTGRRCPRRAARRAGRRRGGSAAVAASRGPGTAGP